MPPREGPEFGGGVESAKPQLGARLDSAKKKGEGIISRRKGDIPGKSARKNFLVLSGKDKQVRYKKKTGKDPRQRGEIMSEIPKSLHMTRAMAGTKTNSSLNRNDSKTPPLWKNKIQGG